MYHRQWRIAFPDKPVEVLPVLSPQDTFTRQRDYSLSSRGGRRGPGRGGLLAQLM